MEQLFKVLKQLMGPAGMLAGIPKPVRLGMTYLGAAVAVMVIFKYAKIDQTTKTFLIVAIVIMAVITGIYYAWKGWKQKQQNQQFGGEISQHSAATPRGLSDPGQRARLDDMRKKFQTGVEAYKSRGKDLYKLPWYVIVGEPGSGKTEAVRHSNVGFPPGMQDEFQGVGGTINMNWWFTNHAVLLDTAGRLMFEEVKPGETSEWKEFLTLLKKNRPNCPINGLFLVIPSDSLIKDSADSIQKKAGKIAQQLDVIQRVLDVRFPVFVVVTKCDKINGFREFFDGLTDPQLQHQITGWSNPAPLDVAFQPELVDKHLEQVGARLRRRRMGLMRDPVPENTEGRRTDEVDSLYAFPHSLELIASRLRRYLETIFIAGEWSAKPLFLRGIYFSSSMREGSALDQELAEAIGVGVDELPEGKVWERERAYFLRDLFIEKVFREKGLVTRASNTKTMLRSQQIALYGFGFVALIVFVTVAWFAAGSLRTGVKSLGDNWQVVSAGGWENRYWKKSIVPIRGDGSFASDISTNAITVDNKALTPGEFHAKLRDLSEQPLKSVRMFPGLADRYNQNSRRSQRIVFEAGVVRPLLDAARQKMSGGDTDTNSVRWQPDALAALIQLEADMLSRGTGTNKGEITPEGARKFLASLENYVAGREVPVDTNLVAVMAWTYSTNDTAKGTWPPRWLSGGKGGTNTLAVNTGINAGLDMFVRSATNGIQGYVSDWNQISSLRASARVFADTENALFTAAGAGVEPKFVEAQRALETARKSLKDEIARASKSAMFADGISLTNAQQKFRATVTASAGAAFSRVRDINDAALSANKDYPLFKEIKVRLEAIQSSLSNRVAQLLESGDLKEFQVLDETCLADGAFEKRADLYARVEKKISEVPFAGGGLIGSQGEQLKKFTDEINALRAEAAKSSGRLSNEFARAADYEVRRTEKAFFASYLAEANRQIGSGIGFPLIKDVNRMAAPDKFIAAGQQLRHVSEDMASPLFKAVNPGERFDDWKVFIPNAQAQQAIARALLGDEGVPGACTISLAGSSEATADKDKWRESWRDMKMIFDGGGGETIRTQSGDDQKLGDAMVQKKFELRLIRNAGEANSPTFSVNTADWGPVWLLHQYKGEKDRTDASGRTWLVEVPMKAPGSTGSVRLKLKFERALPDLDKWPAA